MGFMLNNERFIYQNSKRIANGITTHKTTIGFYFSLQNNVSIMPIFNHFYKFYMTSCIFLINLIECHSIFNYSH